MSAIGRNVRHARRLRGMTQQELAADAHTTQHTVSAIERGQRDPHPTTLRKIADALGVEVADFFREADPPKARRVWELPEDEFLAWLEGATDEELSELREELGELLGEYQASVPSGVPLEVAKAYSDSAEGRRGQLLHRRTLQVIRYRQARLKAELERLAAEEAELINA